MKRGAGMLNRRLRFDKRTVVDETQGNQEGGWVPEFYRSARLRPMNPGAETVIASRLRGVVPYELTLRNDPGTRQITEAWRAVDERSGETFNLGPAVDPNERTAYLILTCTTGTANG